MSLDMLLGLLECETYSVLNMWGEEQSVFGGDADLRTESDLMEPESAETSSDSVRWCEAYFQTVTCVGAEPHGYEV